MSAITPADIQDQLRYRSLADLKAANNELLKRRREEDGLTVEFLVAVNEFLARGCATGAILNADTDRWAGQTLLDYWINILNRAGYQPTDVALADFDTHFTLTLDDSQYPYVGLEPFRESASKLFYGREELKQQSLKGLQDNQWLSILGPSGSGKSSFVFAGLLPALKDGKVQGSQNWHYYQLIAPGSDPLGNLASIIQPPPDVDADEWFNQQAEAFRQNNSHLLQLINAAHPEPALIVCDQFEEIFTLTNDEIVRQAFINNLVEVVKYSKIRHTVIVTMRSDMRESINKLPDLKALFAKNSVRAFTMSATELRDVIEIPAALVGLKFGEGVVDNLIDEVSGELGGLSLLQFTLLKLWDAREGNLIPWNAFQKLKSSRQALTDSADDFYDPLPPEDQSIVRRILMRLVRWGDGLEVFANRMRRASLFKQGESREETERVLNSLIQAGVVRETKGDRSGTLLVEVAFEALLRKWDKLAEWLESERVNKRRHLGLSVATKQWDELGRDPNALWRGSQLEEVKGLQDLEPLEALFVEKSIRKQRNEKRIFIGTIAGVIISLVVLVFFLFDQVNEVTKAKQKANARKLAAQSLNYRDSRLDLALLLGLSAYENGSDVIETRSSLLSAIEYSPHIIRLLHGHTGSVRSIAFSPTSQLFASTSEDKTIRFWNVDEPKEVWQSAKLSSPAINVAFNQTGEMLASGSDDGSVILWDVAKLSEIFQFTPKHQTSVIGLAFSPDGKTLVSGSKDGVVSVWDIEKRAQLTQFSVGDSLVVRALDFSRDASKVVCVLEDGEVVFWDVAKNSKIGQSLPQKFKYVTALAFSPDGANIAIGGIPSTEEDSDVYNVYEVLESKKNELSVWTTETAQARSKKIGKSVESDGVILGITFPQESSTLAISNSNGVVNLLRIDGENLTPQAQFRTGHIWAMGVAFNKDGSNLAAGSLDGIITLFDANNLQGIGRTLTQDTYPVLGLAFSHDGKILASRATSPSGVPAESKSNPILLWDVVAREEKRRILIINESLLSIAFSPDDKTLASGDDNGLIILWDLSTLRPRKELKVPVEENASGRPGKRRVESIAFSPDGLTIASFANTGEEDKPNPIYLWDATTGELRGQFKGHVGPLSSLAFSPDGKTLASGGRGKVELYLWDVVTKKAIGDKALLSANQYFSQMSLGGGDDDPSGVNAVSFSPDGKYLASAENSTITLWDVHALKPAGQLIGHKGFIKSLSFSRDGNTLISGGTDKIIILWNVLTLQQIGQLKEHEGEVLNVIFNPRDETFASSSTDGTIILWDLNLGTWQRIARRIANRDLSQNETALYIETSR